MKIKRIFFAISAMIFAIFPAFGDTVLNNNQTVPNSCIVDVMGVSNGSVLATATWTPATYNCAAGTYLPAGTDWANDNSGCIQCPANNYCAGGEFTYNESTAQGKTACPTGYTSTAGSSAISQCQTTCPANTYIASGAYTRLEYLESTGTQYIDTGISISNTTGLKTKFNRYSSGDMVVVGIVTNSINGMYVNPASHIFMPFAETWSEASFDTTVDNTDYEVQMNYMNDRKRYINGVSVWDISKTLTANSNTLYLFAGNYPAEHSANWYLKGRVYYLEITEGANLVQNLIPVRRNSDNVLGMLDLVTGTFFTNAGTGTFIAGPDVGAIGGTCSTACATGHHSTAHTVSYGTASLCDPNTININWADANGTLTTTQCTYGGSVPTPTTAPTKRGHVFGGWNFVTQQ